MSLSHSRCCLAIAVLCTCAPALCIPAALAAQTGRLPQPQPAVIERIPLSEPVAVIEAAYQLADGSVVVVADPRSSEPIVFVIDSTGKSRRIGRKGDGPGEYTHITASAIRGDSIGLFQRDGLRLTVIDLTTGLGRTEVLDQAKWRSSGCAPTMVIPAGVVCQGQMKVTDRAGVTSSALHWVPSGAEFDDARVLSEVKSDTSRYLRLRVATIGMNRYLSWDQRSDRSPSHRMFAILDQQRFGTVDSITVRITNLPSWISQSWSWAAPAIRPTNAQRSAILESEMQSIRENLALAGLPDENPDRSAVERAFALPEMLPAYRMFHVGDDGCIWLRRNTADTSDKDPRDYDVLDFSGRLLKSVRVAMPVRLSGVTCNDALGILFEEDGELGLLRISPQPK
jgi:hypothetical protein